MPRASDNRALCTQRQTWWKIRQDLKSDAHKLGSTFCLLQNDSQDLCSLVKEDDLSLGIFYPVLWSSNKHASAGLHFLGGFQNFIQKLSLVF